MKTCKTHLDHLLLCDVSVGVMELEVCNLPAMLSLLFEEFSFSLVLENHCLSLSEGHESSNGVKISSVCSKALYK